jgi:hypothetical protein
MTADLGTLFDFIEKENPHGTRTTSPGPVRMQPDTCRHATKGWTLEVDAASPHCGRWVDADPACRLPGF